MRLSAELARILKADLGKNYDPQRALDFLRTLSPSNKDLPEAKRLNNLLENPKEEDEEIQMIYETPFVRGVIVIAGKKTRKEHPLTAYFPMHFLKTYRQKFSRWETPPSHEENMSKIVWKHFEEEGKHNRVPLALGAGPNTFRSQLLEGKTLGALAPVHNGADPKELAAQIMKARKHYGPVGPLWAGMESVFEVAKTLGEGGMLHHDLHEQNMLISPTGEGYIIDFETTEEDDRFGTLSWESATKEDMRHLTEMAALTRLCAGPEEKLPKDTALAKMTLAALGSSPKLLSVQQEIAKLTAKENKGPELA